MDKSLVFDDPNNYSEQFWLLQFRAAHNSQEHRKIQQSMTPKWHCITLFYCEKELYYNLK